MTPMGYLPWWSKDPTDRRESIRRMQAQKQWKAAEKVRRSKAIAEAKRIMARVDARTTA